VDEVVAKLKIEYVQRPPRQPEDLPDDVVEVYISISGRKIDLRIGRHGFMASELVIGAIRARIRRVAEATTGKDRPLAERLGLSPVLSPDWRQFLEDLLQKCDSWAFFVPVTGRERPN
jgi:hypothetical protein